MARTSQYTLKADTLVITPLAKELEAFLKMYPQATKEVHHSPRSSLVYHTFRIGSHRIVATQLEEMGNPSSAATAAIATQETDPANVLVVGIAAGVGAAVNYGDVLIASSITYYEHGKDRDVAFESRALHARADSALIRRAQSMQDVSWASRILVLAPDSEYERPDVHFGPIACGEKVVANAATVAELQRLDPKLIGIEMEAYGAAYAVAQCAPVPRLLVIRGVTDRATPSKGDDWHPFAAQAAAAFAAEFIDKHLVSESTLRRAGRNGDDTQTIIIRHQSIDELRLETLVDSLPESFTSGQIEDVLIDQTGSYSNGRIVAPWTAVDRQLCAIETVKELRKSMPVAQLVYAGLVHIPFAFLIGQQLEKCPLEFYERGRDGKSWWTLTSEPNHSDLIVSGMPKSLRRRPGPILIEISISYTVNHNDSIRFVADPVATVSLSQRNIAPDTVTSISQLNRYGAQFRQVLDDLRRLRPEATEIHIFYAGPVALAIRLGQYISPRIDRPVLIYNYFDRHPYRYDWVLRLNDGPITQSSITVFPVD